MVELKGPQQQETEGNLQFHSRLTLMECTFAPLSVLNFLQPLAVSSHECADHTHEDLRGTLCSSPKLSFVVFLALQYSSLHILTTCISILSFSTLFPGRKESLGRHLCFSSLSYSLGSADSELGRWQSSHHVFPSLREHCLLFIYLFWPHCLACRILVPRPGMEPGSRQ